MMRSPISLVALAGSMAMLMRGVHGVSTISNEEMTGLLDAGGVELAMRAQPMFFFGQAMNQAPCYPTNATNEAGEQTPSAKLCDWPNVGCGCRNPGVGIVNPGPAFPVYYTYKRCTDREVRIAYNLFYEKDGMKPDGIFGHPYDWERVIVLWARNKDGSWQPSQLFLSQHSGYDKMDWADIQNTLNAEDAGLERGGDRGRTNLDHAKVYVAWSKHAAYEDRNTGWNDALSQLTNNAFRSNDWWYFPTAGDYLRSDPSTELGQQLGGYDWGDATSNPPHVHSTLCEA